MTYVDAKDSHNISTLGNFCFSPGCPHVFFKAPTLDGWIHEGPVKVFIATFHVLQVEVGLGEKRPPNPERLRNSGQSNMSSLEALKPLDPWFLDPGCWCPKEMRGCFKNNEKSDNLKGQLKFNFPKFSVSNSTWYLVTLLKPEMTLWNFCAKGVQKFWNIAPAFSNAQKSLILNYGALSLEYYETNLPCWYFPGHSQVPHKSEA